MKFEKKDFTITQEESVISFWGVMDFPYSYEIENFLNSLADKVTIKEPVTLNFKELVYANSSAIRLLGNFVVRLNKQTILHLNKEKTWQKMALKLLTTVQDKTIEIID